MKRMLLAVALSLLPVLSSAQTPPATDLEGRRKVLATLLSEQWEYRLRTEPEFASILGDKRYNDRLTDYSQAFVDSDLAATAAFLKRFEAIDTAGFPPQEQLNKQLMVQRLALKLEGARFKPWEIPVLQNSGIHIDLPHLVASLSFETVKDYEDYLARLKQLPQAFAETTAQMRNGMRDGLMPPKFLLPKIVHQCEDLANAKPADSPFARPLSKFPVGFSEKDRERLRGAILAAITDDVNPAYKKFAAFVQNEYLPKGRHDVGVWSLPNGAALYAYDVRVSTTTGLNPEQIHQLGLSEVNRIEAEMLKVAQSLGFANLKSFKTSIQSNAALHPKSRQEILDLYVTYLNQMEAKLPLLFGRLPKAKLTVLPIEEYREKEASTAYDQGTPDGSRPGHVMVNTGDFAQQTTLDIESTAYHEGVPGHHLQISIAQELPDLPPFRQQGDYNAYVEGWALYAEQLGKEVGFYTNPYSYYGHLQEEMLRAVRLVVDTGLHEKHWSRQRVVDFFHAHYGGAETEVQSETDRYIVWPAQALGYKVGELRILELRDYAKQQLGAKFDIRAFHDEVLGAGALPLDVLEQRIKAWVKTQQS